MSELEFPAHENLIDEWKLAKNNLGEGQTMSYGPRYDMDDLATEFQTLLQQRQQDRELLAKIEADYRISGLAMDAAIAAIARAAELLKGGK